MPPTAPRVYDIIARYKPTLFFSVPTNFGMLLSHEGDFDLSSVRYAVSAGEALPEPLFRRFKQRFGVEILDAIGSTECLHMFIANRPGQVRPGSSGQLVPGYDARIVDEHDQPVPVGEMGNLLIKGDSTCAYYWNQHEKTKQTIQGEWIRTGDKYYCDADGYYCYGGRTDDMLKAGGIWVSPVEIESVLIDHDAVQECAVIGRDDGDGLLEAVCVRGVASRRSTGTPELAAALQNVRARAAGGIQASARRRVRGRAAEDGDRQAAALQAARRKRNPNSALRRPSDADQRRQRAVAVVRSHRRWSRRRRAAATCQSLCARPRWLRAGWRDRGCC